MSKKFTKEDFISKAIGKHGSKYNYSLVDYKNIRSNVNIVCGDHGVFTQRAKDHLYGAGCRKCSISKMSGTTEDFITISKSIHGDRYAYTRVVYKNNRVKVIITCKEHGDFEQSPDNHFKGKGCPKCGGKQILSTREVVSMFLRVHGSKYDYSSVVYKNSRTKVSILCKEHGEFLQSPNNHLKGVGCSRCAKSGYNTDKPGTFYVYVGDFVGFGVSNRLKSRTKVHKANIRKHKVNLKLVCTYEADGLSILELETLVKREFAKSILNTGVPGFKTEALPIDYLAPFVSFVEGCLTEVKYCKIMLP